MDLLRENIENTFSSNVRNIKSSGVENIKRHVAKPLSDVKNILSEKGCLSVPGNKKDQLAEVYTKVLPKEVIDYGDELCFYEEPIEDYRDIIPLSLQLSDEDLSSLCAVFDCPGRPKVEQPLQYLPLEDPFIFTDDDEDAYLDECRNRLHSGDDLFLESLDL